MAVSGPCTKSMASRPLEPSKLILGALAGVAASGHGAAVRVADKLDQSHVNRYKLNVLRHTLTMTSALNIMFVELLSPLFVALCVCASARILLRDTHLRGWLAQVRLFAGGSPPIRLRAAIGSARAHARVPQVSRAACARVRFFAHRRAALCIGEQSVLCTQHFAGCKFCKAQIRVCFVCARACPNASVMLIVVVVHLRAAH